MKPMLAKKYEDQKKKITFPAYIQPKLNGVRALYHAGQMQSRDQLFWNPTVVEHVTSQLRHIPDDVVLDGEFYIHTMPLQHINGAISINRNAPSKTTHLVEYHVFDCVDLRGLGTPFRTRYEKLQYLIFELSKVKVVPANTIHSYEDCDSWFFRHKAAGYEGSIIRLDEPYGLEHTCSNKENRWDILLKRKDWLDEDCLIVDVELGTGKYESMVGSLVLVFSNGRTFRAGSGLTDMQRQRYLDSPPTGLTAKIKYEMLSDTGVPLKPTIECVNE